MAPPGWYSRGYLPHFDGGSIPQFVTFRTAGSLPRSVLNAWQAELRLERRSLRQGTASAVPDRLSLELYRRAEAYLDEGHGPTPLREARIGMLVENALLHFDLERYRLHAWVVMPNHVHVLFTPGEAWTLAKVVQAWKSWTGRRAQALLKKGGAFWQREYFDRYMRTDRHFWATVQYIEQNPVKAGLCQSAEEWVFSSARRKWERRSPDRLFS